MDTSYASCEVCGAAVRRKSRFVYYGAPAGKCPECGHVAYWVPDAYVARHAVTEGEKIFRTPAWRDHASHIRPLAGMR